MNQRNDTAIYLRRSSFLETRAVPVVDMPPIKTARIGALTVQEIDQAANQITVDHDQITVDDDEDEITAVTPRLRALSDAELEPALLPRQLIDVTIWQMAALVLLSFAGGLLMSAMVVRLLGQ